MRTVPEIRLHQADRSSGLSHLANLGQRESTSPYWAYHWAGGIALARYLLDQPDVVAGRRVLDLGAGSGIVGIAAAKAGAREVLASDIDVNALVALGLNATANDVTISSIPGDLISGPPIPVDLVLIGDLFYEPELAARVTRFLDRCLESGIGALVGDPGRAFLPRSRLRRVRDFAVSDFGDGNGVLEKTSAVFSFHGAQ
ncbi:MAG: 50S ribosomal protein L11 methyltransferase [Hyphomonadaceae bacterium]|nr:50S ribosomal protein L11 methyltransferase [Hyphomonadaceae bacterium]